MPAPIRAYLSSTVEDLAPEREAVIQALANYGVIGSIYRANEDGVVERSLADVADCELYIGILGLRYGWVPSREAGNPEQLSITELEYRHAAQCGIPRLMFLKSEDAIPVTLTDYRTRTHDPARIEAFRAMVSKDLHPALFKNTSELREALLLALADFLQRRAESTGTQSTSVFLCYRRDDSSDAAGRLHDRLVSAYGQERVFIDIDSVPLGVDFVEHVAQHISKCRAVIVVIGRRWLSVKDKRRHRRLDNDDDMVRAEVRAALQLGLPLIPVVVQGASMPHADELPIDIQALARRNGIVLRAEQWKEGVDRLLKELDAVLGSRGR